MVLPGCPAYISYAVGLEAHTALSCSVFRSPFTLPSYETPSSLPLVLARPGPLDSVLGPLDSVLFHFAIKVPCPAGALAWSPLGSQPFLLFPLLIP